MEVIELRKEGLSIREIQKRMENIAGIRLPISTIQGWIRGTKKPSSIVVP